jgi:hypothetical protein
MKKVKLLKGFTHDGRVYQIDGEFEGWPYEIDTLARQGYCKQPDEETADENESQAA